MSKGERLSFVDTAKFLAIWMVIVSHCCMKSDVARFLFAFHVPLFFFLYGFVYHTKEERISVFDYLKTRIPSLFGRVIVPYLLLAFILGSALSVKTLPFVLWGSLQSLVGVSSTHLWFLPCYFLAVLIFGVLSETLPKRRMVKHVVMGGGILALAAISSFLDSERDIVLNIGNFIIHFTGIGTNSSKEFYVGFPLALNVAFTGVVFIYAGYIFRKLYDIISKNNWMMFLLAVSCAIMGTFLFYQNNGNERLIAMSYAQYGNYLLFLITAILLCIAALVLSKYIDNGLFSKMGKYTLAIYGIHLSLVFIGNRIFSFAHITDANFKAIIVGTITLVLSCAVIPVIRYIDPNILGERTK